MRKSLVDAVVGSGSGSGAQASAAGIRNSTTTDGPLTKSGFLLKKGEINRAWRVRWFALKDTTLYYFKSPEAPRASGTIDLTSAVVRTARQDTGGRHHAFEVVTRTRIYQLVGKSREDTRDWIRALSAHTVLHTENEALEQAEEMIAKASRDTYWEIYGSMEEDLRQLAASRAATAAGGSAPGATARYQALIAAEPASDSSQSTTSSSTADAHASSNS